MFGQCHTALQGPPFSKTPLFSSCRSIEVACTRCFERGKREGVIVALAIKEQKRIIDREDLTRLVIRTDAPGQATEFPPSLEGSTKGEDWPRLSR